MTEHINVLIGTPVGGGVVSHEYMHGILEIQRHFDGLGWKCHVITKPDGLVTRSRNIFGSLVVRDTTFTHLLMIDADVVISPEGVERLVRSGHSVCGSVVAFRNINWDRVKEFLDVRDDATVEDLHWISKEYALGPGPGERVVDGFRPVIALGSAVMMLTREALVELSNSSVVQRATYGLMGPDRIESGWTFFDPFVDEDGVYLSEDYALCHRWRSLGHKVWADLRTPTLHIGPVAVDGNIAQSMIAAKRLTEARRAKAAESSDRLA